MEPIRSGSYAERELEIQREILRNGPVISNIVSPRDFRNYKFGFVMSDEETEARVEEKLL